MIPKYNKIHKRFRLNGSAYSFEELQEVAFSHIKLGLPFEKAIGDFLIDWLDEKDYVIVKTSGSTGIPKLIKLQKQAMVHSAIATGDFFNLKPGNKALHGLPSRFIAGKMMLVRAIILGLELDIIEPKSQLVFDNKKAYDFSAMVPLQLQNAMKDCNNIKTIIVGGASVSIALRDAIQNLKVNLYETYGMTETVTHIAVKKLNNFETLRGETTWQSVESDFKTLPNINISQDSRNCLVINAPKLNTENIITNDVIKLISETEFQWLGRYDNVINSGGVKLFPEQIEAKLSKKVSSRFFITKEADQTLGERLVMVLESESNVLDPSVFNGLEKFETPKIIYSVEKFLETPNGKIRREATLVISK